jgi:hypothetical protein
VGQGCPPFTELGVTVSDFYYLAGIFEEPKIIVMRIRNLGDGVDNVKKEKKISK